MTNHLEITRDVRGVATVTLNRPEVLNAFDEALIADLHEAFTRLAQDATARVVVLAAAGRAFCAGADIAWMQRAAANDAAANLADARRFASMMQVLASCPKPVLARVQGAAFGGGVGLICAADIAIATDRAQFAVSEAKFGILPAVIGPYLIQAVGVRRARQLALTCTRLGAADALASGLIHQVVAEDRLDAAVAAAVDELLAGGPGAQAGIKSLFGRLAGQPIDDVARELSAQAISQQRATPEATEGFAAFMAKRPAAWVPIGN